MCPLNRNSDIYVLGGGAIGFSLAAHLKAAGRRVVILRAGEGAAEERVQTITVQSGDGTLLTQEVLSKPLSAQGKIDGVLVLATKATANEKIATRLSDNASTIDLVVMQNGIGVEGPFIGKGFRSLSRCVVYITAERVADCFYTARMVKPSPIGNVNGASDERLECLVDLLTTTALAFYREGHIDREVWKKGIINTVFNSVCPLLDTDNGVFERDADAMAMAECLVKECVPVAKKINISIEVEEILEQILAISKRSSGQLISTLQDIRGNRETEIRFFNLEICRVARNLRPPIELPLTRTLGFLILKKSEIAMKRFVGGG